MLSRRDCLKALSALSAFSMTGMAHAAKAEFNLKFGHTGAPDHHYQTIAELFGKRVSELTGGGVSVAVFPSDQLGKQLEITEGVMMGTHDLCQTSDTILSNWIPDMGIGNLPFIFNDDNDYRKVFDGPIGEKFAKLVEPHGAIVIGWWENGMRHVSNNLREIKLPADMKGMNIRVPEGEVFVDTFKALGANPTVVSFGELYSALQLKTVDGQENPPAHIVTQKYKDYQKAILQAGREMGPIHTKMVADLEVQQWKQIAGFGMKITDVDKAPFRKAVEPVIEKWKKTLNAKLIEEVQACVAG